MRDCSRGLLDIDMDLELGVGGMGPKPCNAHLFNAPLLAWFAGTIMAACRNLFPGIPMFSVCLEL